MKSVQLFWPNELLFQPHSGVESQLMCDSFMTDQAPLKLLTVLSKLCRLCRFCDNIHHLLLQRNCLSVSLQRSLRTSCSYNVSRFLAGVVRLASRAERGTATQRVSVGFLPSTEQNRIDLGLLVFIVAKEAQKEKSRTTSVYASKSLIKTLLA